MIDFYYTQNTMQMNEPVDAMNRCASDIAERLFFLVCFDGCDQTELRDHCTEKNMWLSVTT